MAFWPALVSRGAVAQRVIVGDLDMPVPGASAERLAAHGSASAGTFRVAASEPTSSPRSDSQQTVRVALRRLCLARSGDKGDTANIGVIGRSADVYAWMLEHLT